VPGADDPGMTGATGRLGNPEAAVAPADAACAPAAEPAVPEGTAVSGGPGGGAAAGWPYGGGDAP
jgi:hypothetical protein